MSDEGPRVSLFITGSAGEPGRFMDEPCRGLLQERPLPAMTFDVMENARRFLLGRSRHAGTAADLFEAVAEIQAGIPDGERYAYRARCSGGFDVDLGLHGPCPWEGATSREAGGTVPACPACGGLTEPVAETPRLRRVQ